MRCLYNEPSRIGFDRWQSLQKNRMRRKTHPACRAAP